MKVLIAFLIACALPVQAGDPVVLYARLLENLVAQLGTGEKCQMEKGNCFPVVAYKQSHTLLLLEFAGKGFVVPANRTEIVPDKDLPAAVGSYRAKVASYLDGASARWRAGAEAARRQ
jgi:hypothetical protein